MKYSFKRWIIPRCFRNQRIIYLHAEKQMSPMLRDGTYMLFNIVPIILPQFSVFNIHLHLIRVHCSFFLLPKQVALNFIFRVLFWFTSIHIIIFIFLWLLWIIFIVIQLVVLQFVVQEKIPNVHVVLLISHLHSNKRLKNFKYLIHLAIFKLLAYNHMSSSN